MPFSISDRLNRNNNQEPNNNGYTPPDGKTTSTSDSSPIQTIVTPPITESASQRVNWHQIKSLVQRRLLEEVDLGGNIDAENITTIRRTLEGMFNEILAEENIQLPRPDRVRLFEAISAEILAFGPLEPLLQDETITEIMVNGPDHVWVERNGRLEETNVKFDNEEHVRRIIERIIAPLGRRCDENSPMVDARLPDGSRVNAIIPPLSLVGPVLTIRKFSADPLTVNDLLQFGTLTPPVVEFLKACVKGRLNMVVSGGTGSGKTTLLNVLSSFIPDNERIITIEDAAELQLRQRHVVRLEKRPPNAEGKGEITIRDLVVNSLRMRPDRIIVGEVRSGEALDMLQAMNTGHDGSLTTLHSNSPRDTLARLETMVLMSGMDLPLRAIREQIASAIDIIVHQERLQDGSRKVVKISEVQGMEGDTIVLQDIFEFRQYGMVGRQVVGELVAKGTRPKCLEKLAAHNIHVPPSIFQAS
ncbi:type II secretion system protein E [Thermobaculum terrenum ATCC BAA-798]|uniref:Type II secretion system protein E n=1 Tax=Thermobaculum terrenum (strain ATCC BAA-798 / CCMEE 7001 / YNP1) TaxID=525904 RepID=D1CG79_THET1|nr:CpaF family protein [Thermobaculum terrenum]ACZ41935.1 type II secretion system protein E [Thermobaculum terrenum ATCC BAA-798]